MSDMVSRHAETVCLSERSEMLCYLVHKYTSYKHATTIHSERVTYQRGTLRRQPYFLFHIYIYIYIYIYNQRRSKPAIISRIPCSVEIMGIENLITETPACVFRFNKITQSKLRNRKKGRLVYRYDVRV